MTAERVRPSQLAAALLVAPSLAAAPALAQAAFTYNTVTEERQVSEEVRKEQIEVDGDQSTYRDDRV